MVAPGTGNAARRERWLVPPAPAAAPAPAQAPAPAPAPAPGNVTDFSAAISACEKGGQWQRALSLFDHMCKASVTMDVISLAATGLGIHEMAEPGTGNAARRER